MSWTIVCRKGVNPLAWALQNVRVMRRSMEWMGGSPLVQSHTQRHMYVSLVVSLFLHPTHIPQLHFNLTDATHWMNHYNGFSYEEFYEFIIDFFEADTTPEAQEASAKLLEWWNKYISNFIVSPPTADMKYSQCGVSEVCSHTCSRT